MLSSTAMHFDSVNLSPVFDGKMAASISVNRLDVELKSVTIAVSSDANAN